MKSLSETLLPTAIRPFLTFRTATYLGCGIFVLSSLLRVFVTLSPSAAAFQDELLHRPAFLIGYNCLVALVMFVVFATRRYNRLYYARVYVYLLFLAGLASELAGLLSLGVWHEPITVGKSGYHSQSGICPDFTQSGTQ